MNKELAVILSVRESDDPKTPGNYIKMKSEALFSELSCGCQLNVDV